MNSSGIGASGLRASSPPDRVVAFRVRDGTSFCHLAMGCAVTGRVLTAKQVMFSPGSPGSRFTSQGRGVHEFRGTGSKRQIYGPGELIPAHDVGREFCVIRTQVFLEDWGEGRVRCNSAPEVRSLS